MTSLLVWARARVRVGSQSIYLYRFDHPLPVKEPPSFGAFHTGEVPFVFGNLDAGSRPWDAVDRRLSREMQESWLAFMKSGDPNAKGRPQWPRVSESSDVVMAFDLAAGMRPAVSSAARRDVLEGYALTGGELSLF